MFAALVRTSIGSLRANGCLNHTLKPDVFRMKPMLLLGDEFET